MVHVDESHREQLIKQPHGYVKERPSSDGGCRGRIKSKEEVKVAVNKAFADRPKEYYPFPEEYSLAKCVKKHTFCAIHKLTFTRQ
jgi:hypothetical protein